MTASLFAVSFSPSAVWSGGQVSRLPFLTGAGRVLFALTILSYLAVFTLPIPTYYAIKPIGRMVLQSAPMGFLYAL